MRPEIATLIDLQKTQSEIARLRAEVGALPARVAAIEAKLAGAKQKVAGIEDRLKKEDHGRRARESEIKDWNAKIVKLREQSSSVKTNEQYKALLEEIAFAERQISDCEEKIIISMEETDALKRSLSGAQAELKEDQAEVDREKEHARSLTAKDEAELEELEKHRHQLRTGLDENMLLTFDRIVAKRGGGLAEVINGACSACHVGVRPQRLNDLLNDADLVHCDSCTRILYVDPSHQEALAERKSAGPDRAWFFLPGDDSGKLAYVTNTKGSCSLRTFDAQSGKPLSDENRKKTTYQEAFAEVLRGAQPLHLQQAPAPDGALDEAMLEELQLQANLPVRG